MRTKSKIWALLGLFGVLIVTTLYTCAPKEPLESEEFRAATQIAQDWNLLILDLERHTPGYRPPVSARMYAYVEMAAYEAALPAMPEYFSMERYCPGYVREYVNISQYCLPVALNAAFGSVARLFFPTVPPAFQEKIRQLESKYQNISTAGVSDQNVQVSMEFGRKTAQKIWAYSATDTIGHDGFMFNYDSQFKPCEQPGCWTPNVVRPMPALLPNWGNARTFLANKDSMMAKPPANYDERVGSAFYSDAMEVFSASNAISSEERWIAEFWSDDVPGLTMTPSGRWISIANQAINASNLPFQAVMETYLRVGLALCDAGIVCWKNKYIYQVERPESYIKKVIQPSWSSLHENPSFPAYPSGHAMFGAAAAEVLTGVFGKNYTMTDRTHEGRKEFQGKPRHFDSFAQMAQENALSRLLLGVHFRMDGEEGLRLGKIIGQKAMNLTLRKAVVATL